MMASLTDEFLPSMVTDEPAAHPVASGKPTIAYFNIFTLFHVL